MEINIKINIKNFLLVHFLYSINISLKYIKWWPIISLEPWLSVIFPQCFMDHQFHSRLSHWYVLEIQMRYNQNTMYKLESRYINI